MRCLSCHAFSPAVICDDCKNKLLRPTITKRKVGTLEVISLFKYSTIEPFLLTKHQPEGFRIYRYFATQFLKPFLENFASHLDEVITLVGIDEKVKQGYSHTALLSHYASTPRIRAKHATLLARNTVSYAGKSLDYRLAHPRDFSYRGKAGLEVILLDDIVTTGVTLQEAHTVLEKHDIEVLFALTLADARG